MKEDILSETEIFYPILIEEYIRLITAAFHIQNQDDNTPVQFKISKEHYQQIINCPIQAPLIGLALSYNESSQVLSVTADKYFLTMYENKIQKEVALNFQLTNTKRYSKYIEQIS